MIIRIGHILFLLFSLTPWCLRAQECITDSVEINFRVSKWDLDRSIGNNDSVLNAIDRRLSTVFVAPFHSLTHVSIIGGASPEGPLKFNEFLSEHRAAALFDYLSKYRPLTDADKTYTFLGRDWEGVYRLALRDLNIPYRTETLTLLQNIADTKRQTGSEPPRSLERLKALHSGEPYRYLLLNIFPKVRASKVVIDYQRILRPEITDTVFVVQTDTVYIERETIVHDTIYIACPPCRPFYMDIRTNMLYDVLALPNIGVEFYLGKNISVGGNWLYAWWSKNAIHRFWRAYGGEVFSRWWFGREAYQKPLTGHHIGVYGQFYTYDFEWGGDGEMGGKPKGTLWERGLWGVGVEYGYSLPIKRRLNIDFTLGLGYTSGEYHKYKPENGRYVWQQSYRRKLFFPTKLAIALVWLIGCDNYNRPKTANRTK